MKIQRMKLHEEGLNRFFGPLESQIMAIAWEKEKVTIKEVQELLSEELSYTAVMTVLNRLSEKGHLKKITTGKGRNRISHYHTVQSKEEFIAEQTKAVTYGLVEEYGQLVVNHLVDAFKDADPELMKLLEARLNEWKKEQL
ncbi:BlaI/MecI/CopY family transcriptional regulator [Cohnella algarum]|uniref:BlaI/MecI/CopY family transcriptional regulator n=1 Tax=Cohnella algarum TaxID=2044859 RepID=UPI0019672819|nr:BlaI/MecI/CopY family transcriptional regulator [Cohnella algarum]MBN2981788.1 BlaI/MecI/CopY family transcriptional regulator [Cohnella algarum]